MSKWKLEDAKNGFSEVVRRAREDGPQLVTRHGKDAVVVMSVEEYRDLAGDVDLVEFLRNSPMAEAMAADELSIDRPTELGRDIALQ
jgi:prevent-host-death family protein